MRTTVRGFRSSIRGIEQLTYSRPDTTVRRLFDPSPYSPAPVVSEVVTVGNNEDSEPVMWCTNVCCEKTAPFRIEPEIGKVSEYTTERPERRSI